MSGNPFFVAAGDVDGDGKLDLAVATSQPMGTGGMPPQTVPGVGGATGSGGGTGSQLGGTTILLNGGTGAFVVGQTYPVTAPTSIVLGNLDSDGKNDFAVVSAERGSVDVWTNTGTGTYRDSVSYSVGINSDIAAIGDLNSDGLNDLAITNVGLGASGDVAVLQNMGGGAFVATNYAAGQSPAGIALADLNGDGKIDLAIANLNGGVSVLLNRGDGSFGAPIKYAAGSTPAAVVAGDLNGDGKIDLAAADLRLGPGGGVTVLLNLGNGTFGAGVVYAVSGGAGGFVIGDLTGDGLADLALTYASDCVGVSVLANKGKGVFASPILVPLSGWPSSLALGDWNGDGKADLAVANGLGVQVLMNAR